MHTGTGLRLLTIYELAFVLHSCQSLYSYIATSIELLNRCHLYYSSSSKHLYFARISKYQHSKNFKHTHTSTNSMNVYIERRHVVIANILSFTFVALRLHSNSFSQMHCTDQNIYCFRYKLILHRARL